MSNKPSEKKVVFLHSAKPNPKNKHGKQAHNGGGKGENNNS